MTNRNQCLDWYSTESKAWRQSSNLRTWIVSSYLASVITRRECGPDLPDLIFHTQKLDIRVFVVTFQFTSYTKISAIGNTARESNVALWSVPYSHLPLLGSSCPFTLTSGGHSLFVRPLGGNFNITKAVCSNWGFALGSRQSVGAWEQKGKRNREKSWR